MSKLQRTRILNERFAVYISDTPVTIKQSQGHKPCNENTDPKQGCNALMVPKEKANMCENQK